MVTKKKGILSQTPVPTGYIKSAISMKCLNKPLWWLQGRQERHSPHPYIYSGGTIYPLLETLTRLDTGR